MDKQAKFKIFAIFIFLIFSIVSIGSSSFIPVLGNFDGLRNISVIKEVYNDSLFSYNSFTKEVLIEDKKNNTIIKMKLTSPYIVSGLIASKDTKVAEFYLKDWKGNKKNLIDSISFYDINQDYKLIDKNFRFKYGIDYESCYGGKVQECFNYTSWTEFTDLNELPYKNIKISLWAETEVSEKIEWVFTIEDISIFQWAEWDVSTIEFVQTRNVSNYTANPRDVAFKPDGTRMYTIDNGGIDQWDLSKPWNISTAVYKSNFGLPWAPNAQDVYFRAGGETMYVTGIESDKVWLINMTDAWNVSSGFLIGSKSVKADDSEPQGVSFKPDGTKMFILGYSDLEVNEYNLSIAWNVSTAEFVANLSIPEVGLYAQGLFFSTEGDKMYTTGYEHDYVVEYNLAVPWNVSTASHVQNISIGDNFVNPTGLYFSPDGTKMYATDNSGWVGEYNLPPVTPNVTINSPANQSYGTTSILFNVTSEDETAMGNCSYSLTNGTTNHTMTNSSGSPTQWTATNSTMSQGSHTAIFYCKDLINNLNNSESVIFFVDTTPPEITIDHPKAQAYPYNESLPLNYTVDDSALSVDSCWYNIYNSTNDMVNTSGGTDVATLNTTISNCLNTTFNLTVEDIYNLTLYSNDTLNNENCESVTFLISLIGPAVNLDYPTDNEYLNNATNIYFNFTATDEDGLDTCELWTNHTGTWHKNYTWINPTNTTMNFTKINVTQGDGIYKWSVWCNDTSDSASWALNNFTFIVDETYPNITINSITSTIGSQTISFNSTEQDLNKDSCKYSIFNSVGGIDGINENVSYTCGVGQTHSATTSAYGTFDLIIYVNDSAGNENSSTESFTTSGAVSSTNGGGGGGTDTETIPVIALKQIAGKIASALERAIFYARINTFCSIKQTSQTLAIQDFSGICSLKKSDIEKIQGELSIEGIQVSVNDLILFYEEYNSRELEQVYFTLDVIETYDLFTSVLGITNPMRVNPPRLDRPFMIFGDGNFTIEYIFVVNKKVKECSIISGDFKCEIITDNSVKMILDINHTDFFDEVFSGEMSITSDADPQNLEVKRISLFPRIYNFSYRIAGIPAIVLLIVLGIMVLLFSIFFIVRSRIRKKLKRRKS